MASTCNTTLISKYQNRYVARIFFSRARLPRDVFYPHTTGFTSSTEAQRQILHCHRLFQSLLGSFGVLSIHWTPQPSTSMSRYDRHHEFDIEIIEYESSLSVSFFRPFRYGLFHRPRSRRSRNRGLALILFLIMVATFWNGIWRVRTSTTSSPISNYCTSAI